MRSVKIVIFLNTSIFCVIRPPICVKSLNCSKKWSPNYQWAVKLIYGIKCIVDYVIIAVSITTIILTSHSYTPKVNLIVPTEILHKLIKISDNRSKHFPTWSKKHFCSFVYVDFYIICILMNINETGKNQKNAEHLNFSANKCPTGTYNVGKNYH